jgi:hypothetical protein
MSIKLFKIHRWYDYEITADVHIGENIHENEYPTEVIRIHHTFFFKSKRKQRVMLRLLIWWSIKHYFKTLFKSNGNENN